MRVCLCIFMYVLFKYLIFHSNLGMPDNTNPVFSLFLYFTLFAELYSFILYVHKPCWFYCNDAFDDESFRISDQISESKHEIRPYFSFSTILQLDIMHLTFSSFWKLLLRTKYIPSRFNYPNTFSLLKII